MPSDNRDEQRWLKEQRKGQGAEGIGVGRRGKIEQGGETD
jgi:hypothetical protein